MLEFAPEFEHYATIKVVGVGGAGGNAVNRMIEAKIRGVEFIVVNTDAQVLRRTKALQKIQIGSQLTKGLGAGGEPGIGRLAAEEDRSALYRALEGADMVFITAGMGGGTGTGAAPVIAEVAAEHNALRVGVVTKPFHMEGTQRLRKAEAGLKELAEKVDTLIVIPNERLLKVCPAETSFTDAFRVADDVLMQAVRGISEIITVPGLVNVDFADVRSVMASAGGSAIMGIGAASGEGRAAAAAQAVISSPLLDGLTVKGARGLLVNVTGGLDMTLHEVDEAVKTVRDIADEDANVIFGAVVDEALHEFRITVIATGFETRAVHEPMLAASLLAAPVARPASPAVEIPPPPGLELEEAVFGAEFDIPAFIRQRSRLDDVKN